MIVKTVADAEVLAGLVARLAALRPDSPRRWGTLTPHEMLCHLGDSCAMVTRTRPRVVPVPAHQHPVLKLIWLWSPMPWPHGRPTNPMQDPKAGGTRPTTFRSDRERVVAELSVIASGREEPLEPAHGLLGAMSRRDWQRWAYRHTDYHLRQFGV